MISAGHRTQVWPYPEPTDLRRGFNGLFGLVQTGLGRDPLSGELFLFVNRRRSSCKVLLWDGTGLVILMKRLEKGRFAAPWERGDGRAAVRMTGSELALFLEGCSLAGRQALSPLPIEIKSALQEGAPKVRLHVDAKAAAGRAGHRVSAPACHRLASSARSLR